MRKATGPELEIRMHKDVRLMSEVENGGYRRKTKKARDAKERKEGKI
jgi:hypothetical protein